jgi:hypothetical protein
LKWLFWVVMCQVCAALVRDRPARVRFCDAGGLVLLAPLLSSPDVQVLPPIPCPNHNPSA